MRFNQTKLQNGMHILEFCDERTHVFHFEFISCFGMDDETSPDMYESAHSLEHMIAKYTSQSFPHAHSNTLRLEGLGISKNAFTSSSMTGYYMEGGIDALKQALTLSSNVIANFQTDANCFESELRAVENELRAIISREWHDFDEFVNNKLYANHPRSKSQQARLDNVSKLTPQFLTHIYKNRYQPSNLRVIFHGNKQMCEHKEWQLFKTMMSKLQNIPAATNDVTNSPTLSPGVYMFSQTKANNHCKFTWTFPLNRVFSQNDSAIIDCTTFLLSQGFASRLYHRLRTQLGLVYAIHASGNLHPQDSKLSMLYITATCKRDDIGKAIQATAKELLQMTTTLADECDMKRWRNAVRTSYFNSISDTSVHSVINNARMVARFDLPYIELQDQTQIHLAVQAEDVRTLCKSVFTHNLKSGVLCYSS